MWTNLEWVRLVALACLLRGCWEASRPAPARDVRSLRRLPQTRVGGGYRCNLTGSGGGGSVEAVPEPRASLPPQAREWMRKELRRYREAQERKWRRWAEAVYEPKP